MNFLAVKTIEGKSISCFTDEEWSWVNIGEYKIPPEEFFKLASFYLGGGLFGLPKTYEPAAEHALEHIARWLQRK